VRREQVINWTLLTVLVAVSIPGGIRMWNRKMAKPTLSGQLEGTAVRQSVPYMTPAATTQTLVVPPTTAGWLAHLGRQLLGAPGTAGERLSAGKRFEVLAIKGDRAAVIVWDENLSAQLQETLGAEVIEVPRSIGEELRKEGYVTPPTRVAVWVATVDDGAVRLGAGALADEVVVDR
jgi:hypothetical protein